MVSMLLDTNILVDLLRSYTPAITWKNAQGSVIMGICSIVYLTEDDQKWAIQQVVKYKLSHNVGMTDALIAAPAYRLNLPLHTRNTKHFLPMIPNLVNQPY